MLCFIVIFILIYKVLCRPQILIDFEIELLYGRISKKLNNLKLKI